MEALLAESSEASYAMSPGDLAEALADEAGVAQPMSGLREPDSAAARTALRAANAAYESRFGHVFVVCLDGIAPDEVLDEVLDSLRTRLDNTPEAERLVAAEQLRRIALARLERLVAGPASSASADSVRAPARKT